MQIIEKWIEDDSVSHQGFVLEWNFDPSRSEAIQNVIVTLYKINKLQFVEYVENNIVKYIIHLYIDENETKDRSIRRSQEDQELIKSLEEQLSEIKARDDLLEQKERLAQEKLCKEQAKEVERKALDEEGNEQQDKNLEEQEDDQQEKEELNNDQEAVTEPEIEEDEEEKEARLQREKEQRQIDARNKLRLTLKMYVLTALCLIYFFRALLRTRNHDYNHESILRTIIVNAQARKKYFYINAMLQTNQEIYHCVLQHVWRSVPSILAVKPSFPEDLQGKPFSFVSLLSIIVIRSRRGREN